MLPSSAEQREASQLYGAVVDETFPHGTLDAKYWSFPGVTGLKVRGANYLQARLSRAWVLPTDGMPSRTWPQA